MHRSSFSVEEMDKIKRLHTKHGLDVFAESVPIYSGHEVEKVDA